MRALSVMRGLSYVGLTGLLALSACKSSSNEVKAPDRPTSISKSGNDGWASAGASKTADAGADDTMTGATTSGTSSTSGSTGSGASSAGTMDSGYPVSGSGGGTSTHMSGGMTVSGRAYPTGNKATSAVYLEKKAPVEVILGTPYEYTLSVKNLTNDKLESVVVTDSTGSGFTMKSSSPSASSNSGGVTTWAIGDLGAGEMRTITINGVANGVDMVTTCADVSYASKLCLTTRFVEPALKIEKSGPAEVMLCDAITYTITVSNPGSGAARNVRVSDNLPNGIVTESGQSNVEFTIPELAAGATKTYNVSAKANRTGTFDNNASAAADGGLNASSNTVTTTVRQPRLALTMSCPGQRFGGQVVEYRLAVSNDGDAACANTVLEASIPGGSTFMDASNGGAASAGKVQWMLGSVAPGGSADVSFRIRADALGPKTSNATVTCACSDPAKATCTTEVEGIPAILLEVVDLDDPVPVGSSTTYVITVTNQGSLAAEDVTIGCNLESQMEYVSSSGATTGTSSGGSISFAPLASLAPKAKAEWRVVIKATAEGDVRFGVNMNSKRLTRPVEETEATNFYE